MNFSQNGDGTVTDPAGEPWQPTVPFPSVPADGDQEIDPAELLVFDETPPVVVNVSIGDVTINVNVEA